MRARYLCLAELFDDVRYRKREHQQALGELQCNKLRIFLDGVYKLNGAEEKLMGSYTDCMRHTVFMISKL